MMTPFSHFVDLVLAVTAASAGGCFVVAWLDIAVHRRRKIPANQQEMRRYMLCGFYCNPEDPRPVVHRPLGRGYTINLRREMLVVTLLVMSAIAMVTALLVTLMPKTT